MSTDNNSDALLSYCYEIDGVPVVRPASLPDFPTVPPVTLLRLSANIGLPLNFSVPASVQNTEPASQEPSIDETSDNPILRLLSTRRAREEGSFESQRVEGLPRPVLLIARADGKQLKPERLTLMWKFVEEVRIDAAGKAELSDDEKFERFLDTMTPGAFVEWWNRSSEADTECPVELTVKECE